MAEYIEREVVLNLIEKEKSEARELCVPVECKKDFAAGLYRAEKIIKQAPTADVVEVKHGEWDVNVGMNFNKERICPICKKRIESNYWEFCSHCGAKMDGERKENE